MVIKVNFCQKIELSVLLFLPQKKSIYRFQKSIYRFPVNTVTLGTTALFSKNWQKLEYKTDSKIKYKTGFYWRVYGKYASLAERIFKTGNIYFNLSQMKYCDCRLIEQLNIYEVLNRVVLQCTFLRWLFAKFISYSFNIHCVQ